MPTTTEHLAYYRIVARRGPVSPACVIFDCFLLVDIYTLRLAMDNVKGGATVLKTVSGPA